MAVPALKALIEEDPSAIGLVLVPSGEEHEGNFVLACAPEAGIDLRNVLKKHPELKARGGGAPAWVNGVTGLAIASHWVEALKNEAE